ncbi:MAG: SCP2 sterol-binding domain-containing protein [Acidimicrobiales bacterium]
MTERYEFLSAPWVAAARAIRDEYQDRLVAAAGATPPPALRMNLTLTDGPDGTTSAHVDTTSGQARLELEHLPQADVSIFTDHETARAIFVAQDGTAAMTAFMSGKIRVEGDLARLLALQAQAMTADPLAAEIATRVKAITAD